MLAGCPDAGKQIEPAVKPDKPGGGTKPAYSFTFGTASHKMTFTKGGTYTQVVIETNKPRGDKRAITYASSDNKIATVDNKGVVTFVSWGKVTITATRTAGAGLPRATASYILTIAPDFAFGEATLGSRKVAFTARTYSLTVDNTNKPAGDARDIIYTSSEGKIATVDNKGVVTFVTPGTVTITATKTAGAGHEEAVASYILYITTKPATKADLVAEITRATTAHGNEVDLNYIDTAAITDMSWLFSGHAKNGYGLNKFNGDISKWDVSQVTDMRSMFEGATAFNGDISKWDVSQVTDMRSMFDNATAFNGDISEWKVSNVTTMRSMFYDATTFNQNISEWKVSNVTTMRTMFCRARAFDQDISRWDVSNVTNMHAMFYGANAFNRDISSWKVGKVTHMKAMFYGATAFNQDISRWDVSKVTNMKFMFQDATSFDQDISGWDVSQVTTMTQMFIKAKAFKQNLDAWGQRLNPAIKANSDYNTYNMFLRSGLVNNLPSWCRTATGCF